MKKNYLKLLPHEIILSIINILQRDYELRAIMNLCKYLKWDWSVFTNDIAKFVICNHRNRGLFYKNCIKKQHYTIHL